MLKWLGKLVDSNEKELRKFHAVVEEINSLEPGFAKLTDAELRAKTDEFKARLKDGASLDELLPEAFAAVREAAKRASASAILTFSSWAVLCSTRVKSRK